MTETILKRKIYNKLLSWKNESNGRTAMLIEGARRVGKSTIAIEFGKNEYRSYILIDFNNVAPEVIDIFINDRQDMDLFFNKLKSFYKTELYQRDTLIIFDEVQQFPIARSFIKYLVADGRYDYLETGSLIRLKKNVKDIVIPSEEDSIEMFPLDYEEFCWALGDTTTVPYLRKCFENRESLGSFHNHFMNDFRTYLLVGGMPQAVIEYAKYKDFEKVDKIKKSILKLYHDDIYKYGDGNEDRVLLIYDNIPGELSKGNKKFILSSLEVNARNREYKNAFMWLNEAMIVNICVNTTDPNIGLALTADTNSIKCYSSDTGLLVTQTFINKSFITNEIYKAILFDNLSINEGMIIENYVAQVLRTNGYKLYFYTNYDKETRSNAMEVDFIIVQDKKLNPIEVKSGNYNKHTSIDRFKKKYGKKVGTRYVLHTKDLKVEGDIIYLPLYMAMFL